MAVGANNGGHGRENLRYAVSDARNFANVMRTMGGVKNDNCVVILEPEQKNLLQAIDKIARSLSDKSRGAGHSEFIFYYSGHSDEEGLLIGNERFAYRELRTLIDKIPSDVKIAVLDSCSSGAFTRIKGGAMVTPFMSGRMNSMKGFAFMTSSSSDEVSQESERIKGSFFTHYLLSGLRGAADMTRDRKVTLNEAYQYAYRETLTRTQKTAGGAQHPNYNIQMSGTGDVVLTEIRTESATLTFGESVKGRIYINSEPSIIAEINKAQGEPVYLALDSGRYQIVLDIDDSLYEAGIKISKGSNVTVEQSSFTPINREATGKRGSSNDPADKQYNHHVIGFFVFPNVISNGRSESYDFLFNIFGSSCDKVNYSALGIGLTMIREEQTGSAVTGIGNIIGGESRGFVFGGIFNISHSDAIGLSMSGVANISMKNTTGMQFSGVANTSGKDMDGAQVAGISNIVLGSTNGMQLSGVVNVAGLDFTGVQMSCVNLISNKGVGVQAGLVNVAGEFTGAKIGLVNVSRETTGVQVGLVNVDKDAHGVQLGLINYSDTNDGYPIGLFSFIKNGITAPMVWLDETGTATFAISHGNKRIYNIFPITYSAGCVAIGAGIGVRWMPESWILSIDAISTGYYMHDGRDLFIRYSVRFSAGYTVFDRVNIFAGISYSYMKQATEANGTEMPVQPIGDHYNTYTHNGHTSWYWPGAFAGVQYLFGKIN